MLERKKHLKFELLENRLLLASDATFFAIADAFVRDGGYASTNYGPSPELHVKNSISGYQRESFLKFDLRSMGDDIGDAKLRVFARLSQSQASVPLELHTTSNSSWTEAALNWNNKPIVGNAILGRQTVGDTTGAWYEFDVTSYLQQQKNAGEEFVTFVLMNTSGNSSYTIVNSDESASGRPHLVIATPQEPGFILSEPIVYVPEGQNSTFTVRLASQPDQTVRAGIISRGDQSLSLDRSSLEFTSANWNVAQTITISAAQDVDARNGLAVFEISDVLGAVRPINGVYVVEQDDDVVQIVAAQTRFAVNDAFVRDGSPTSNYGDSAELQVKKSSSGYNREAFLRYDVSSFPALVSAKLRVFGELSQSSSPVATAVFGAASNWNEGTLAWNTRPATLSGALDSRTVSGTGGQWYEFDVTPFVLQQRAAGAIVVTLVLKNASGNSSYTIFNSSEATTNRPELVLSAQASDPSARAVKPYSAHDVLSWLSIGHSAPLDADRHVGYGIKEHEGWTWFVNNTIQAEYDWGIRRFVMHNPFGSLPGEVMQFDQYLHAQDAGLSWLTDDFVSAWSTWIAAHPDAEVIAYIGTLDFEGKKDPDFIPYDAPDRTYLWFRRAMDSIQPLLDSGISIAFDTGGRYAEGSAPYNLMRMVESLGVRIYTEPLPFRTATHLHDLPSMALFDASQMRDPESYLQDEEIWIMGNLSPRPGETRADTLVRHAREALSRGLRPALRISDLGDSPIYQGIIRYKKLSDIIS